MSGAVVSAGLAIIVMARVVDSVETLGLLGETDLRRHNWPSKIDFSSRARGALFIVVGTSTLAGVCLLDTKSVR